jgi:group I intron endonuclease
MVIYKTTNLINGLQYIGKDKNNDPYYIGSGSNLKKAIKEYGKCNFKKEIIEHCYSISHLIEREEYWLAYYNAESNPNFYNKTNKAFGNSGMSEENKINIKQGLKNRKWDPEWNVLIGQARQGIKHKNHVKGDKHGNYGKSKSEEHKKNMSKSMSNVKRNKEWCDAIKNNRENCIKAKSKPVLQLDKNNNILNEYKSITDARNITGIKGIKNVVIGLAKTAGNFIWKYK